MDHSANGFFRDFPLGDLPFHEFLDNQSHHEFAHTNQKHFQLFDPNKIHIVFSDELHMRELQRHRIKTLGVVVVENGWEKAKNDDYHLPNLQNLVLGNLDERPPASASGRAAPTALKQWLPTVRMLDITDLTNPADMRDVVTILLYTHALNELRVSSAGLNLIGEWDARDRDLLAHIPCMHVTLKGDSVGYVLAWLYEWATQRSVPSLNNQRLIIDFPMYDTHIMRDVRLFETLYNERQDNGVNTLHVVIRDVDVDDIEYGSVYDADFRTSGFAPFNNNSGQTTCYYSIHIKDMRQKTASWFQKLLSYMCVHIPTTFTTIDLTFTEEWTNPISLIPTTGRRLNDFTERVQAVKRFIHGVITSHVIKTQTTIRGLPTWKDDNDISEAVLRSALPETPILQINLKVPDDDDVPYFLFVPGDGTRYVNKKLQDVMMRLGSIKYNVI